jgi:hypothetical protein
MHDVIIPGRTKNRPTIITFVEVDFNCPSCSHKHGEDFWYKQLDKSDKTYIYKKCLGCKTMLGITVDMTGDVKVWLKKEEQKHG